MKKKKPETTIKKYNQRDFKGIWIPAEIWLDIDLTLQEKVFLAEIDSLDGEDGCYASNDYFADFFQLSKKRVSVVINNLVKKKYIVSQLLYKNNAIDYRILRSCLKYETTSPSKKVLKNQEKGIPNCKDTLPLELRVGIPKCGRTLPLESATYNKEDNKVYKKEKEKGEGEIEISSALPTEQTSLSPHTSSSSSSSKSPQQSHVDVINEYTEYIPLRDMLMNYFDMRQNQSKSFGAEQMGKRLKHLKKITTEHECNNEFCVEIVENAYLGEWKNFYIPDTYKNDRRVNNGKKQATRKIERTETEQTKGKTRYGVLL